jgi:peptidoglycan/LPS O-acetylase OafA/YrhL
MAATGEVAFDFRASRAPGQEGERQAGGVAAERGFHIASLDGIRAVAALTVFAAHTHLEGFIPGGFGVTVFFFLSGYLITTLLRRELEETGDLSLKHFYLRRVYRIFPPLYLVLGILIALGLAGVLRNDMSGTAVLAQLAHLTNYYIVAYGSDTAPVVPNTVPFWSLAVEEHFYLLFPLALLFLFRRFSLPKIALVLAAVCATVLAWRCVLVFGFDASSYYVYNATDTRIDSLLFGCILGVWCNPAVDAPAKRLGERGWFLLCALGVALLLVSFLWRADAFRDTLRYTLQGLGLFPLFYCAVRFHGLPVFAWLDSRPMRALGVISYTFYLSHEAALELARQALGDGPLRAAAGFALAVAFSGACYFLVERRFARLRRRLHG